MKLLDFAKAKMWLFVIMKVPFPRIKSAINSERAEVLFETVAYYEDYELPVEVDVGKSSIATMFVSFLTSLWRLLWVVQEGHGTYSKCFEAQGLHAHVYQLFNDTQTFCNEVKKITSRLILAHYDLSPPSTAKTTIERLQGIKDKARTLLEKLKYLHGEQDASVIIFLALPWTSTNQTYREGQAISYIRP